MSGDNVVVDNFTGGCQCGAIRYEVSNGPVRMILCHCDMCRHATGSPLPGFVSVPSDRIIWAGEPAEYRSSSVAQRGFCPKCGTPLYYRHDDFNTIGLTSGAANVVFVPTTAYYPEERAFWLACLDHLSERAFEGVEDMERFANSDTED